MRPLHAYFPDIAFSEMRTISVKGMPGLPNGEYGFLELYCDDIGCDCRRVLINAISRDQPGKILATLNYGWESAAFYAKWLGRAEGAAESSGLSIDPFNPQSIYTPILFRLFETCLQDAAYVQRLQRHYAMFKRAVQEKRRSEPQTKKTKKRPRNR